MLMAELWWLSGGSLLLLVNVNGTRVIEYKFSHASSSFVGVIIRRKRRRIRRRYRNWQMSPTGLFSLGEMLQEMVIGWR